MPIIPPATGPRPPDVIYDPDEDPWAPLEQGGPTYSMNYAAFIGITLDPGMSLADTAAQHGVMGKKAFKSHEAVLWNKYRLRPIKAKNEIHPVGIGGASTVLARCAVPVGIGRVNGLVMFTVLDDDNVPALTPISTLKVMGAIIDLPGQVMHFANCGGATTEIKEIETGHQQHSLLEFPEKGWVPPSDFAQHPFQVKQGEKFVSLLDKTKHMSASYFTAGSFVITSAGGSAVSASTSAPMTVDTSAGGDSVSDPASAPSTGSQLPLRTTTAVYGSSERPRIITNVIDAGSQSSTVRHYALEEMLSECGFTMRIENGRRVWSQSFGDVPVSGHASAQRSNALI